MQDPLDNIMGALRGAGSIDPAQASARKARMSVDRNQMGVAPQPQANQLPGTAEAGVGDVQVGQQSMTPVLVDQLNEAILTIKVQIHREQDRERRRALEVQADQLRQQIQTLGGEPIYADETVEEGLQKLQGQGFIGFDRLMEAIKSVGTGIQQVGSRIGQSLAQPNATTALPNTVAQTSPTAQAPRTAPLPHQVGVGAVKQAQPFEQTLAQITGTQRTALPQPAAPRDQLESTLAKIGDSRPSVTTPTAGTSARPGLVYQPASEFSPRITDSTGNVIPNEQLANEGGYVAGVNAPPLMLTSDYITELNKSLGISFRSDEELLGDAKAMVERQALPMRQRIQREIDRFESTWPNEFERAKTQIDDHAKTLSAEKQEEFAARGTYYSSIMSNALTDIDDKAMDLIGEIARDAANRVADLHRDLMDVDQWAILEQEVMYRELKATDQAQRTTLRDIHIEVARHSDLMSIDRWYKEATVSIQNRAMELDELKFRADEARQIAGEQGLALLANDATVARGLSAMGISPQHFQGMDVMARAALVNQVISFADVMTQRSLVEAQTAAALASAEASRASASASRAQATGIRQASALSSRVDATLLGIMEGTINPNTLNAEQLQIIGLKAQQGFVTPDVALSTIDSMLPNLWSTIQNLEKAGKKADQTAIKTIQTKITTANQLLTALPAPAKTHFSKDLTELTSRLSQVIANTQASKSGTTILDWPYEAYPELQGIGGDMLDNLLSNLRR